MSEGIKYDKAKNRLNLFPMDVFRAISWVLTFGARKYGDRNWEAGMSWDRVYGALQRHLASWHMREEGDEETKKSHLWHAGCCIVFLIAYELRGVGKDDRPKIKLDTSKL